MYRELLDLIVYFLVLINPVSKIFVLSMFYKEEPAREVRALSVRSSGVALALLLVFAVAGNFILGTIFHVELHSFRLAGGIVLFYHGFKALTKGVFFEVDAKTRLRELSIVPLASPMIAGPATLTAAVTFSATQGYPLACSAIVVAVALNLVFMLMSRWIGGLLIRFNTMGAAIRITGLIVATIGVQMVLSGLTDWLQTVGLIAHSGA